MKWSIISRLEKLEQQSKNHVAVGIVSQFDDMWAAAWNGKSWTFDTQEDAIAHLEPLAETIIVIDI